MASIHPQPIRSQPPSRATNALVATAIIALIAVLIVIAYFFFTSGISYP